MLHQKASKKLKLNHNNHSYTFLPTACTTTKDVDLDLG
jgi:hypothetical protein